MKKRFKIFMVMAIIFNLFLGTASTMTITAESKNDQLKETTQELLNGQYGYSKVNLTEELILYGYDKADILATIEELNPNWKEQALIRAQKSLIINIDVSKLGLKRILLDPYSFAEDEAQYAVDRVEVDWKEQALNKVNNLLNDKYGYSKNWILNDLEEVYSFTKEEAKYAMDKTEANWKEQALKKANYLLTSGLAISRRDITERLEQIGLFTKEEVKYAFDNVKVDWKEQAVKKANKILVDGRGISKKSLYFELKNIHQFTASEAQYAKDNIEEDWKGQAVKRATWITRDEAPSILSTKAVVQELLWKEFTKEEADYAVKTIEYDVKQKTYPKKSESIDIIVEKGDYLSFDISYEGVNSDNAKWHISSPTAIKVLGGDNIFEGKNLTIIPKEVGIYTISMVDGDTDEILGQKNVKIVGKDESTDPTEPEQPEETIVLKSENITLETAGATNIPKTAKLEFKDVSSEIAKDKMEEIEESVQKTLENSKVINLYDISLLFDGKELQPNGDVKITIPLSDEMKHFKDIKVVYISDTGETVEVISEVKNGEISFTTDHFSYYAIVGAPKKVDSNENKNEEKTDKLPNTGIVSGVGLYASTLLTSLGGLYALRRKKRK